MARNKRAPVRVNDAPLPKFSLGLASVLAQSKNVVEAFGRGLGFVLMLLAILSIVICFCAFALSAGNVVTGIQAKLFSEVLDADVRRVGGRAEAPNLEV